jgi:hypothetical protein
MFFAQLEAARLNSRISEVEIRWNPELLAVQLPISLRSELNP